jgi:hypothetical protein
MKSTDRDTFLAMLVCLSPWLVVLALVKIWCEAMR